MSIKQSIIDQLKITDLADEYDIKLSYAGTGTFSHKCTCPHKDHKNGSERTMSMYIDSENNTFCCFGCGWGSNVIDFYMGINDIDFSSAISEIRDKYNIKNSHGSSIIKVPNNYYIML